MTIYPYNPNRPFHPLARPVPMQIMQCAWYAIGDALAAAGKLVLKTLLAKNVGGKLMYRGIALLGLAAAAEMAAMIV